MIEEATFSFSFEETPQKYIKILYNYLSEFERIRTGGCEIPLMRLT
jgi:hypothetical protein